MCLLYCMYTAANHCGFWLHYIFDIPLSWKHDLEWLSWETLIGHLVFCWAIKCPSAQGRRLLRLRENNTRTKTNTTTTTRLHNRPGFTGPQIQMNIFKDSRISCWWNTQNILYNYKGWRILCVHWVSMNYKNILEKEIGINERVRCFGRDVQKCERKAKSI